MINKNTDKCLMIFFFMIGSIFLNYKDKAIGHNFKQADIYQLIDAIQEFHFANKLKKL